MVNAVFKSASFQPASATDAIYVLRSERWACRLPDPNRFAHEPIGVSETRGIVGGVEQPVAAAHSETIERSISDALTVAFTEVLDDVDGVSMILIRGPAFPKTLGRFLSLRAPVEMNVAWITPFEELVGGAPLTLNWFGARSMAWDYESLLNSFPYPEAEPKWTVEFLDLGESRARYHAIVQAIDVTRSKSLAVPRALAFAETRLLPLNEHSYVATTDDAPAWLTANLPDYVLAPSITSGEGRGAVLFRWKESNNSQEHLLEQL